MQKQVEIKQGHYVTELKPNFELSHMTRFTNNNNNTEFPITQIIHLTADQPKKTHCFIIFFKVHLESKTLCCCCSVIKLCLTLCGPMDCSTPGFTVLHHLPQFVQTHIQGQKPGLPHCRQILYHLSHQGSPLRHLVFLKTFFKLTPEMVTYSQFHSNGSSVKLNVFILRINLQEMASRKKRLLQEITEFDVLKLS